MGHESMKLTCVGHILPRDRNNFNLLRLAAASAVVISHAIYLHPDHKNYQVLSDVNFYDLGAHAVNVFFVLSGLTVAASLSRSTSTLEFIAARALRILPALAACALLTILLGVILTSCATGQFLSDMRVWRYGVQTLLLGLGSASAGLPGVFAENPVPSTVNGSIWTLKYEVACYLLLAATGWLGLLTRYRFAWLLGISWTLAGLFLFVRFGRNIEAVDQAARFWLCFTLGVAYFVYRDSIPLTVIGVAALGLVFWTSIGSGLERLVSLVATSYAVVWFAKLPTGRLRYLANKVDLSYGMYIFGWPISQTLILMRPEINVVWLVLLSLGSSAAVALPSWMWIERPTLRARGSAIALLGSGLDRIRRRRRPVVGTPQVEGLGRMVQHP